METTRVTRSLRPGEPGTRRLQLSYGSSLVCVRYRETADGQSRWTTIEVVIDRRPAPACMVCIAADPRDLLMNARLRTAGARWDEHQQCWVTNLRTVRRLKLQDHILDRPLMRTQPTHLRRRGP